MTYPKMKPCPKCGLTEFLEVYDYDGWKHVECNNGFNCTPTPPATEACHYLGPGEGTILRAIREHNKRVADGTEPDVVEKVTQPEWRRQK